jgi:hypothetical protein
MAKAYEDDLRRKFPSVYDRGAGTLEEPADPARRWMGASPATGDRAAIDAGQGSLVPVRRGLIAQLLER